VTILGHIMAMPKVRIARLKARLSYYLRRVRKGQTFTVYYRDTPVADLVPHFARRKLKIRPPLPGALPLHEIPLPEPLDLGFDIVELLLEDRARR